MKETTTFTISNDTEAELIVVHEPEGFEFNLDYKDEIKIETQCCKNSIALIVSVTDGKVLISIRDEKSLYSVYCKGENVFEKYLG